MFTLKFEDYAKFWETTGYGRMHGRTAASLSIDRIDPNRGYEPGNIRALSVSENVRRRFVPFYQSPTPEEIAATEAAVAAAYASP